MKHDIKSLNENALLNKVGTIRGDKASINSIARARKKGKISDKAAKRGMKMANERKQMSDRYKGERDWSASDQGITNRAVNRIESEKRKKRVNEIVGKQQEHTKKEREALEEAKANAKTKKDGNYTKDSQQKISGARGTFREAANKFEREVGSKMRTKGIAEDKKKIKELREKREKMREEANKNL